MIKKMTNRHGDVGGVGGKRCCECGRWLPMDSYGKLSNSDDGHQYKCKGCLALYRKQYYQDNKEHLTEKQIAWRRAHSEQCKEYDKQYREKNKERIKEIQRRSYQKHKESRKEGSSDWRRRNRERSLASTKKWQAENKERMAEYYGRWCREKYHGDEQYRVRHNIRSTLNNVYIRYVHGLNVTEGKYGMYRKIMEALGECPGEYGRGLGKYTIDHIIPLSIFDLTNADHLKVACHVKNHKWLLHEDNYRKGATFTDEGKELLKEIERELGITIELPGQAEPSSSGGMP